MEDGNASGLPTKEDQEFRPFVRRLPEFKFWYSTTKAIAIGFFCSWFEIFNLPVFWPVLVVYWLILFGLTSESILCIMCKRRTEADTRSATTNPAHDQVPLRPLYSRKDAVPWRHELGVHLNPPVPSTTCAQPRPACILLGYFSAPRFLNVRNEL
jgi:hypothetical protein